VICVENVPEFEDWGPLGPDGRPSKDRRGQTFIRWVRDLRKLGYAVDWRVLDASEYGAPTKRRRLFIVARHDGQAIEWPAPTHGPGLAPLRTAAECVDWSMPCPSIFERKRPLAEKTLWRIAHGIQRYMFDAAEPFIVRNTRGQDVYPGQKRAIVSAFISRFYGGSRPVVGSDARSPLPTVTAWDHNSLAAVCLAKFRGTHPSQPGSAPINAPLPTISAGGVHVAEVRAFLANYGGKQLTITARNRFGIVTVAGVDYQIIDVGLRMLQPHELLAAQFGRFASGYDLSLARTKTNQIRLIGNSVCPEVAESLVRANFGEKAMVAA
jgi:DNA (cytosine-5)-methyltransferase 1